MVNSIITIEGRTGLFLPYPQPGSSYRIPKGASLQFKIEACSINASKLSVCIEDQKIKATQSLLGDWTAVFTFNNAGCTKVWIEYTEPNSEKTSKNYIVIGKFNWILVDPEFKIRYENFSLKQITLQTLLSRCLGPIQRWESIIKEQTDIGFNMFHLTPIQELGRTQSLYCINDFLKLNPSLFVAPSDEERFKLLENMINLFEQKYGAGFMVDIVLNHCAGSSPFLESSPESTYNLTNCPYLNAAYTLDSAIKTFSDSLANDDKMLYRKGKIIENEDDLGEIMRILRENIIPSLHLEEYFQMKIKDTMRNFTENECEGESSLGDKLKNKGFKKFIKENALFGEGEGRFSVSINPEIIWKAAKSLGLESEKVIKDVNKALQAINSGLLSDCRKNIEDALISIECEIRQLKLILRNTEISPTNALVKKYFVELQNGEKCVCNGFIINNSDTLKDIAAKEGWHYFRRDVMGWNDCVKLRYGNSKVDSPALWERMENYVMGMAKIFKGFRLDNAHGTQLQVTCHLMKKAREINPDLIVMAELFTNDPKVDSLYVEQAGINLLIRESMQIDSPYKYPELLNFCAETAKINVFEENQLKPVPNYNLLYDFSHDNSTPAQSRTAEDSLPNAGLISMTNSAIGSTWGYDDLIPRQISVVFERRFYSTHNDDSIIEVPEYLMTGSSGIKVLIQFTTTPGKKVEIRGDWDGWNQNVQLGEISPGKYAVFLVFDEILEGKEYCYKFIVDNTQWICDQSQRYIKSWEGHVNNQFKIERRLFSSPGTFRNIRPVRKIFNDLHKLLDQEDYSTQYIYNYPEDVTVIVRQNPVTFQSYTMIVRSSFWHNKRNTTVTGIKLPGVIDRIELVCKLGLEPSTYKEDPKIINGLLGKCEIINFNTHCTVRKISQEDQLDLINIPPGFVVLLKTRVQEELSVIVLERFFEKLRDYGACQDILEGLWVDQINVLLWKCVREEFDNKRQGGLYQIQGIPALNYAGLGSVIKYLLYGNENEKNVIWSHFKDGTWYIEHALSRLAQVLSALPIYHHLFVEINHIRQLPKQIVPDLTFKLIYYIFKNIKLYLFNNIFKDSKLFTGRENLYLSELLGVVSTQFWGDVQTGRTHAGFSTIASSLPNFSAGNTRMKGREAMISITGLLLCLGRYNEAKYILITFASAMRHGLIPNVLDMNTGRYNARDVSWLFLQALQNYVKMAPNGHEIFNENVTMKYKSDKWEEHTIFRDSPTFKLYEIVQKILQKHASGIKFREWNAGPGLDSSMSSEGFDVTIDLDAESGLIVGGSEWNAGTWMDRLKDGKPVNPRDGAAIEINGLVYSAIDFLDSLSKTGKYPFFSVYLANGAEYTFEEWKNKLKSSFEKLFWIPKDFVSDYIRPELVGIAGIYKDTVGSKLEQAEYQFRPNQYIAMAVAPYLFTPRHAKAALKSGLKYLFSRHEDGQIGIKTLYSPEPSDPSTFVHNGAEWIWPLCYFLKALKHFMPEKSQLVLSVLNNFQKYIEKSGWFSLPEYTSTFGAKDESSEPASSCSIGTAIELLYSFY